MTKIKFAYRQLKRRIFGISVVPPYFQLGVGDRVWSLSVCPSSSLTLVGTAAQRGAPPLRYPTSTSKSICEENILHGRHWYSILIVRYYQPGVVVLGTGIVYIF